jgi:hypothetical protein
MSLKVVGRERINVMDKDIDAMKITGVSGSGTLSLWITDAGEVLKEESPTGLVLVAKDREEAMRALSSVPDIAGRVVVPFNVKLSESVRYLRVKISGIDLKKFDINGGRQSLNGDILEVRQEDPKENKGVCRDGAGPESQYLGDTVFIQSKNPQIMAATKGYREKREGQDRSRPADLLLGIQEYPQGALGHRAGSQPHPEDHEGRLQRAHGTLCCSCEGGRDTVADRPWPGVQRWLFLLPRLAGDIHKRVVRADPTLGQFPADAAHIRLITEDFDKQALIIAAIGKIRVQGLEYW